MGTADFIAAAATVSSSGGGAAAAAATGLGVGSRHDGGVLYTSSAALAAAAASANASLAPLGGSTWPGRSGQWVTQPDGGTPMRLARSNTSFSASPSSSSSSLLSRGEAWAAAESRVVAAAPDLSGYVDSIAAADETGPDRAPTSFYSNRRCPLTRLSVEVPSVDIYAPTYGAVAGGGGGVSGDDGIINDTKKTCHACGSNASSVNSSNHSNTITSGCDADCDDTAVASALLLGSISEDQKRLWMAMSLRTMAELTLRMRRIEEEETRRAFSYSS